MLAPQAAVPSPARPRSAAAPRAMALPAPDLRCGRRIDHLAHEAGDVFLARDILHRGAAWRVGLETVLGHGAPGDRIGWTGGQEEVRISLLVAVAVEIER